MQTFTQISSGGFGFPQISVAAKHKDILYNCPLCEVESETTYHLLVDCQVTKSFLCAINPNFTDVVRNMQLKESIASWFAGTNTLL